MQQYVSRAVYFVVVLLLFAAGLAWVALRQRVHPPVRLTSSPVGSVTFLGYTNDPAGIQLATFAVTNLSDFAVARSRKCLVWAATPGRSWTPHSGVLLPTGRVLGVGGSEIVAIKPPAIQSPWRGSLYVSNDVGPGWDVKRLINAAMHLIGRPGPYGAATLQIDSEKIEGQR